MHSSRRNRGLRVAQLLPSSKDRLVEVDRLPAPAKGRFRTKLINNNKQKNCNKFTIHKNK